MSVGGFTHTLQGPSCSEYLQEGAALTDLASSLLPLAPRRGRPAHGAVWKCSVPKV